MDWLDTKIAGPYSPRGLVRGLRDAVITPMRSDAAGIKAVRDSYPTLDTLVGIHPAVAAMQVGNDLMAGNADGGTIVNAVQMIPNLKAASAVSKQRKFGGFEIDTPGTLRRNALLSLGQISTQPAIAE